MIYLLGLVILVSGWFFPWWLSCVWASLAGYFSASRNHSILAGGLGLFLPWVIACYYQDVRLKGVPSFRLASLFGLPYSGLNYLLVGFVALILGASAAWFGFELKIFLQSKTKI